MSADADPSTTAETAPETDEEAAPDDDRAAGTDEESVTTTADTATREADTTEYTLRLFRGDDETGEFVDYEVPVQEGMVVLDAIHWIQANVDPELAVRWNCKSGRCGSCGMEIDGMPRLACMERCSEYDPDVPITVTPMKTFPVIKDLVNDVSWNYEVNEGIEPFSPDEDADFEFYQEDVERSREMRKCIECFLCQDVCHVLREHDKQEEYAGPRFLVRSAGLHYHPEDTADRSEWMKDDAGIGYCNVTHCCSDVCPENIEITDNAIIPQKEVVVDEQYDPLLRVKRAIWGD